MLFSDCSERRNTDTNVPSIFCDSFSLRVMYRPKTKGQVCTPFSWEASEFFYRFIFFILRVSVWAPSNPGKEGVVDVIQTFGIDDDIGLQYIC